MKLPSRTTILYGSAAIVFVGAAYYFSTGNQVTQTQIVTEVANSEASQAEQQFITLVNKVDPITFDLSIFSNPRFVGLRDMTTPVVPETVGRKDPFAAYPGAAQ
jgi:hypothetical protein